MNDIRRTAEKIENTIFFYDPYFGPDPGDIIPGLIEQLKTQAGCIEIIDQLCDMLQDA